jgi:hypothetical protein
MQPISRRATGRPRRTIAMASHAAALNYGKEPVIVLGIHHEYADPTSPPGLLRPVRQTEKSPQRLPAQR